MTTIIHINERAGTFAENKDIARQIRVDFITPALTAGDEVCLDFEGVTGATQSFIHALLSEILRQKGAIVLDNIVFKGCNGPTRQIIQIVTDYMQQSGAA